MTTLYVGKKRDELGQEMTFDPDERNVNEIDTSVS